MNLMLFLSLIERRPDGVNAQISAPRRERARDRSYAALGRSVLCQAHPSPAFALRVTGAASPVPLPVEGEDLVVNLLTRPNPPRNGCNNWPQYPFGIGSVTPNSSGSCG